MADASPLGLGAILAAANVQQGIFEPIAAVKTKVTAEDAEFLGVAHGQAESQGPLEAAALALGLWVWTDKINTSAILMRSDSVVALAVARKLTGSSPALNFMGAALSSLLEKAQVPKLTTHHLPGVLNVEADWLSRPDKQVTMAKVKALEGVKIRDLQSCSFAKICSLPSPGKHPELWGKGTEQQWGVFEHL